MNWWIALDALLAFGLTLRLTLLVVGDDIGEWWIKAPIAKWIDRRYPVTPVSVYAEERTRAYNYWNGLNCPFCVGFWIAGLVLLSVLLLGGFGNMWEPWRWVAGWFSLNYVAAHLGARLGDSE
jgi:hypothetical protein